MRPESLYNWGKKRKHLDLLQGARASEGVLDSSRVLTWSTRKQTNKGTSWPWPQLSASPGLPMQYTEKLKMLFIFAFPLKLKVWGIDAFCWGKEGRSHVGGVLCSCQLSYTDLDPWQPSCAQAFLRALKLWERERLGERSGWAKREESIINPLSSSSGLSHVKKAPI